MERLDDSGAVLGSFLLLVASDVPPRYLFSGCTHLLMMFAPKRKKNRVNSHLINHCPMSSGVSEVSERVSAAEGASKASSPEQANEGAVRANGRASGPVLQSGFLVKFWPTVCWRFRG